jgi:7-cyano-7-deazaguanine synthase in queuosine biosynthesis
MILKYGNQTVDFYTKIQSLIEISPYKDRALRDVDYDDNGIPKRIVVSLSGGCDSASSFYLTAKHFPDIEIYPLTLRDQNAPKDADAAIEITNFIKKRFPNSKINDIEVGSYNDLDPKTYTKAQETIDKHPKYKSLNVVQMSKINSIDEQNTAFMKMIDRPLRVDGMTANPPVNVRMAFADRMKKYHPTRNFGPFEIDRVQGEIRRDVHDKPELKYNVYQPFLNVNKRFVAGVFKENNLMDDLYPITRSCVGGSWQTKDFTEWCWQCFWCYEKDWAFNEVSDS